MTHSIPPPKEPSPCSVPPLNGEPIQAREGEIVPHPQSLPHHSITASSSPKGTAPCTYPVRPFVSARTKQMFLVWQKSLIRCCSFKDELVSTTTCSECGCLLDKIRLNLHKGYQSIHRVREMVPQNFNHSRFQSISPPSHESQAARLPSSGNLQLRTIQPVNCTWLLSQVRSHHWCTLECISYRCIPRAAFSLSLLEDGSHETHGSAPYLEGRQEALR